MSWRAWLAMAMGVVQQCTGGGIDPGPPPVDTGAPAPWVEACALAEDHAVCPECYSGEVTCSFDGVEVTAGSCGDCQARGALYSELCVLGIAADAEEIEAGTVCE